MSESFSFADALRALSWQLGDIARKMHEGTITVGEARKFSGILETVAEASELFAKQLATPKETHGRHALKEPRSPMECEHVTPM